MPHPQDKSLIGDDSQGAESKHEDSSHTDGMGMRGVSRPIGHSHQGGADGPNGHGAEAGQESHGGHQAMTREDRLAMIESHHQQTLWIYWMLPILGIWMLVAPTTLGYANEALWVDPSGGRGAWLSDQTHTPLRAALMTWSDVVSGLLLCIFGWRSLTPNRPVSLWICCFVGIWLTMAPVLFWAPTAGAYLNNTLVGALVIALTILIPGMPNMMMYMQMGPSTPAGWSYNPSSWPQRWIMIVLGFLGWIVSRYLAAFQLGYITYVWDPFFGFASSTQRVLNSDMSHMWPISDAALGAAAYTFEFLMGWMGSPARWRTMPWMVAFFGILVIPLGLTHIVLVISQPVVVGHWCALCLLAAAIMLPMIPLELDEVLAMIQHMIEARRRGDRGGSLWQVFWKGGSAEGCQRDDRSPKLVALPQKPWQVYLASIWGVSFPWTLAAAAALGAWLMLAPTVFDVGRPASHVEHLAGALIVTVASIAMGEVARLVRYLNVLLGLIVVAGPWLLEGATMASTVNAGVVGLAVIGLSIPRGPQTEDYGFWNRYVR